MKEFENIKWKSSALDGFTAGDTSGALNGFIGLEECTDYGSDLKHKKSKRKKHVKKRKSAQSEAVPSKKIKLSNGFTVEECINVKPSKNHVTSKEINTTRNVVSNGNKKQRSYLGDKVSSQGVNVDEMTSWLQYEIPEEIIKGLADQGFTKPTKIQELTLPAAMLGRRDILGAAETGSGKTLAFGIPIITGIMKLKEKEKAGVDIYKLPYKKTSIKRNVANDKSKVTTNKKSIKKNKNNKVKNISSDDDGDNRDEGSDKDEEKPMELLNGHNAKYRANSSSSDEDKQDDTDNETDQESNTDSFDDSEDDIAIPYKKKEKIDEESTDSDNYMHLSEMNDFDDDDSNGSGDDMENDLEDVASHKDLELVKEIDHGEIPEHVIVKTGKPLYALILTPTRELAMQISRHLIAAAKYTDIKIAVVVGGLAHVKQERVLSKSPEIVVATPGRLWELIQQGQLHLQQLDHVKFLAIDETDRMVERNHFEELHPILERLNSDETRKISRQNFVFSATLTMVHDLPAHLKRKKVTKRGKIINRSVEKMTPQQKIKKLVDMIGMTDPKVVDITTKNLGTAETLTESRIACSLEHKDYYLHYILKTHPGRTIVFSNSIGSVKRLAQLFSLLNCKPLPLHASMPQRQRLKNLERFRDDPRGVLISTDVAARGLDIPDVDHVIHYQVPRTAENYVHRSGRTARANKEGLTILMIEPGEAFLYAKICRTLNKQAEIPTFPTPPNVLTTVKQTVDLAKEVERIQLTVRKTTQHEGWLNKAAEEMDIVIDDDFVTRKTTDTKGASRVLQVKKKQLENLLSKTIYPKGFSFKYPTLNKPDALVQKTGDKALEVMKKSLESDIIKKQKRASKNAPLLKLEKKRKGKK